MVELKSKKVLAGVLASAMALALATQSGASAGSVKTLTEGFVSTQTGPLAGLGEADKYEVNQRIQSWLDLHNTT